MKIPVKWLAEYVDVPPKSADLAETLTLSGTAVENVTRSGACDILHLEVTTNRPDCLSLMGLAVEVAAVTGKRLKRRGEAKPIREKRKLPLGVQIADRKACPYYMGRVFDNVNVKPSPNWLVRNLGWMDQAPVNNVVDITNFCLFELGQPLHAFDYDKLRGHKIIVRRAKKGEKIMALNNVEYVLDERILVIADEERPVAIAGLIGGLETAVTASTRRVALESAQFDPVMIRRTSRLLKLSTESSYRFERTIDPRRVAQGSYRAAELFMKLAGAVPASKLIEAGHWRCDKRRWLSLRLGRAQELFGKSISPDRIERILTLLGFKVKRISKTELRVKTLVQRSDVTQEADLWEEILRIEGFDRVPLHVPPTRYDVERPLPLETQGRIVRNLKHVLVGEGFQEAVTYSLLAQEALERSGWKDLSGVVRIKNPLSREQEILRPSGIPGLLSVLSHNVNHKIRNLALFEAGKCFTRNHEEEVLTLALTGDIQESWEAHRGATLYYLKGIVENCFRTLRRPLPVWTETSSCLPGFGEHLAVLCDGTLVAVCAATPQSVLGAWDIPQSVVVAEIYLERLLKKPEITRAFEPWPSYPAVRRDVAFVIDRSLKACEIEAFLRSEGGPFLKEVRLFDEYTGKNIPAQKRSLAFALEFQKPDGTFAEEEIRALEERLRASLHNRFGAELR